MSWKATAAEKKIIPTPMSESCWNNIPPINKNGAVPDAMSHRSLL